MWFGNVDIPAAVVDAHRAGDLVLFVGAGASMDPPAGLPNFTSLAANIADESAFAHTENDLDRPDVLLGRVRDRDVDVHRRVATQIGRSDSQPNRLHRGIMRLAATTMTPRVVTTNYDHHLSTVWPEGAPTLEEFAGPALPVGDDFTGLVYLHGRLAQEPRRLVVTDRDFGDAYLRSAWASRFLERMFTNYTVLFVGYSHSDIVMRYLARALGPGAPRFVLTHDPNASDWRELGINPIGYQIIGGVHDALPDALERWAQLCEMGLLDHRQRVADLTARAPSNVPEEASYMEATIEDSDRVGLFAESARGPDWLNWAATQPAFRRLFTPGTAVGPCDYPLADWFAQHNMMDEAHTALALHTVRNGTGRLREVLWETLGQRLHIAGRSDTPRPGWLNPWIVLLAEQAPPDSRSEWLEYTLVDSHLPEDKPLVLLLFNKLTEPHAVPVPSLITDIIHFELRFRGSVYWLRESWRVLFTPHLAILAADLMPIVEAHLRRGFHLLSAATTPGPRLDPVSGGRSAVEPNSQDQFDEPIDILIDAARDCLEWQLDNDPSQGRSSLDRWAASDVPILRRLAVHGWVYRRDVDSDAKLRRLREEGWLFDYDLRHEAYRLVEVAIPATSTPVADALVEDAVRGPALQPEEEYRDYERFNVLEWILRYAPGLASARRAMEQVKSDHPEFEERPHPDLHSWWAGGFVPARPPMSNEELHQRIVSDPGAAVAALRQYEGVRVSLDGPTWHDCIDLLTRTVREHPEDGLQLLGAGQSFGDVLAAIINAWSLTRMESAMTKTVMERLADIDLSEVTYAVATMLADGGRSDATPNEWHRLPESRSLAAALWEAIKVSRSDEPVENWLEKAINNPAGHLTLFWVKVVASSWRDAGDEWEGIPPDICAMLEGLLDIGDNRSALAEPVLARELYFFFLADRAWCERYVRPLLRWGNPRRARRAWDGYLYNPRWNDEMLTDGLLDDSIDAVRHRADLGTESTRHLWMHLANLAIDSTFSPLTWLRTIIPTVDPAERVDWIHQVTFRLVHMSPPAVEQQWHRWIRPYWQDRLASVPVEMTVEEASAMAAWTLRLTESSEQGITLATAYPCGIDENSNFLHDLNGDPLDRDPVGFARLLAHLLAGTQPPFYSWYLQHIIPKVRDHAGVSDMRTITEEALRLGFNITNL